MIGLVEKDTKVVIMTVFHLFKKPDERLRHGNYIYIYKRERIPISNTQIKLQEI